MIVIISERADEDIAENIDYIAEKGYPHNAGKLHKRMLNFIPSLGEMPEKYGVWRHKIFGKSNINVQFSSKLIFSYLLTIKTMNCS